MGLRGRLSIFLSTVVLVLFFLGYSSRPVTRDGRSMTLFTASAEPQILLVSAFYPLAKSKHSLSDYESWFIRFLKPITTDIYFFCPPEVEHLIRSLRGDLPITIDTSYPNLHDIPPLNGLQAKYEEMHAWDKENSYHSPGLYAVWNAKPFFLEEGLARANEKHSKHYDYAFWSDAGSMRDFHTYTGWPQPRRVAAFFQEAARKSGTPEDELIFFPWWWTPKGRFRFWKESHGPIDDTIAEGSFFGGRQKAISDYKRTYYAFHDRWLKRDMFVGKDQMLMNALLFLYPHHFFGVLLHDFSSPLRKLVGEGDMVNTPLGACGSTWWYYQWWLADVVEREETANAWVTPSDGEPMHEIDRQHNRPKGSRRCRDTPLLMANDLLRREYGWLWWAPSAPIPWGVRRRKRE